MEYNNDKSLQFTVNDVSFCMNFIKGGSFSMGATDETDNMTRNKLHTVVLSDYYLGNTEVTQSLWDAVMDYNPSWFDGLNKPIECVSWEECQDFIDRLNCLTGKKFRLPTEAEWEYAARGGQNSQGFKYAGSNDLDKVAWYEKNSDLETHIVGNKQPNELGLYDMIGNVWEWCNDWFDENYYANSPINNPMGPTEGFFRVVRGGSWYSGEEYCTVSYRSCENPENKRWKGFRLCLPFL